ncbi:Alpha/Beta hydrolase protein [Kickxella alabastrina]|uniref:Alpha/Beta hydrolase protein n=1 Tax=Kickxella alabastrina TaxID=61397 RepID=UPI0022211D74|nr:Alpha/Beta hydrolase protein [Kickxella alabastrina]KAI7830864.1 Alpha/Beta hydrolase protein [Kickxella alabastrina]
MDLWQGMLKARKMQLPPLEEEEGTANAKKDHGSSDQLQPLPWSDYFESQQQIDIEDARFNVYASGLLHTDGPIFMFHHGAGHSGLTFGLVCKHIRQTVPQSTVIAPDARGHGSTTGKHQDLSLDRLVADYIEIARAMLGENSEREIILVGHSMGGAVMTHVAASRKLSPIRGLILIDIVEGTALDSLHAIPSFIAARPQSFASVSSAIQWHIDSGAIQNLESARLSVPSLIVQDGSRWSWKTQLMPTEQYWQGWYTGLSKTFISVPTAKLLILAGSDRLDKELLIAQMQGKFQLDLLPAAGHTIQEDLPNMVGDAIILFWKRNQPLNIPVRQQ